MNSSIKKKVSFWYLMVCPFILIAQSNTITLDRCYILAKQNYPLAKQYELIAKTKEYSIQNIAKGYLPQISFNGQATYQSDITELPDIIPDLPKLTKDQYKLVAEVNQPIFDGGLTREQKNIQEASSAADQQQLEVELYQLKSRINQLFFGILLVDEQLKQNTLIKNDLQLGLKKIGALIDNGIALKSDEDVLKAEWFKARQQTIELESNRKAFSDMLGLFIQRPLDETSIFIKPPDITSSQEINRPELLLYDYQSQIFDAQYNLLAAKNRPKISFFVQGGFGKPALDMFKNSFDPFYIGGLRLMVPLSGYYTLNNEKSLIQINKESLNIRKETFLFNTRFALKQQNADINKLREVLKTDDEIIPLRASIKKSALAKLENGVINSNDYLREVNAEDNARQNKILHEIQLLMAQYNQANTAGH